MHIGFLTPEYPSEKTIAGGIATYVRKTAIELYKKGGKVSVFVESNRNNKFEDKGVEVYEIKCPPLYYGLNSRSLIKQLARVFLVMLSAYLVRRKVLQVHRENPIDILQASNHLSPAYCLRNNRKAPLLCRVSSYAPLWHATFGMPRTFGDYLIDYLELRQVTDAFKSFAPSRYIIKVFKRYENCDLDFIPTPLDINQSIKYNNTLLNKILKKLQHRKYLLYFGSLSRIKGIDLMADVINKLSFNHPNLGYVFIGRDYGQPNGKPFSEFIYERCSKHKGKILFFSYKKHEVLYPVIKNSLAVVAPSRVDNYPNNCLEAQSLGVPVIGTTDSSIDELILDNKTGFIAKNSSPESIASKIEILLKMSKKARLEMRKNIRKNISAILAEDRTEELIKYYEKAIKDFRQQNEETKSDLY